MTSKISLRKMIQNELRQNAWLPALISVAALFLYPVCYLLMLQSSRRNIYNGMPKSEMAGQNLRAVSTVLGNGNPLTIAAVLVAAVIAAGVVFSFLDSREKSDFYQSLALKREKAFLVHYLVGWISAVVPYLAAVLISLFGIGAVYGNVTADAVRITFSSIAIDILGFSTVYSFCVLAMVLAGRILVGILLMICFLLYGPALSVLLYGMTSVFFPSVGGAVTNSTVRLSLWLSPFTLLIRNAGLLGTEGAVVSHVLSLLVLAVYLAGAFLAAYLLYRRRPSEAAGNALSFPRMEKILKTAVAVPASVGAGMMLGVLSGDGTGGASIPFVVVFTLLLAFIFNGILEFIIHVDLKSIRKHWRSLVVTLALCSGILVFFAADPFRIDRWLPVEEKIGAMAVYVPVSMDDFGSSIQQPDMYERGALEKSFTENFEPVYQAVRSYTEGKESSGSENTTSVQVAFRMKSGRVHYRYYEIATSEVSAMLDSLGKDKTWREGYYPANYLDPSRYTDVSLEGWISGDYEQKGESLSGSENIRMLAACIRRDMNRLSYQELREETPLFLAFFENNGKDPDGMNVENQSFYIYPEFSETLQYLKSQGVDTEKLEKTGFSADQVIKIDLSTSVAGTEEDSLYRDYMLTEKKQIADLLACTKPDKASAWRVGTEGQPYASVICQDGEYWTNLQITDQKRYDALLQSLEEQEDKTNA